MLKKMIFVVIDIADWIWTKLDMWLNDWEYGSWVSGVRRFYGF